MGNIEKSRPCPRSLPGRPRIGAGGMGRVCRGTDVRDGSAVAIKFLNASLVDASFRERFEREAHVAALLRSPYTVHLLDYGLSGGAPCLVMEFVEGESVGARWLAVPSLRVAPHASPATLPALSKRRAHEAWSTATSSPTTSCSRPTAWRAWRISASPGRSPTTASRRPAPTSARRPTPRRSSSSAKRTIDRTFSHWVPHATPCSPALRRFGPTGTRALPLGACRLVDLTPLSRTRLRTSSGAAWNAIPATATSRPTSLRAPWSGPSRFCWRSQWRRSPPFAATVVPRPPRGRRPRPLWRHLPRRLNRRRPRIGP